MFKIKTLLILMVFAISCSGINSEVSDNLNANDSAPEGSIEEALPSTEGIPQLGEKGAEGIYEELSNTCDIDLEKIGIEIGTEGSWLYGLDKDEISVEMIDNGDHWIVHANDMTCEVVFEEKFGEEISYLEIKCKGDTISCKATYEKISDVFDIYEIYPTLYGDTLDLDYLISNIIDGSIEVDDFGAGAIVSLVHDSGLMQFHVDDVQAGQKLFPPLEVSLFAAEALAFSNYQLDFSEMNIEIIGKDYIYDADSKTIYHLKKDPISKTDKEENQLVELVDVAGSAIKPKIMGDYLFWIDISEGELRYLDVSVHEVSKSISLPLDKNPDDYVLLEDEVYFVYRDKDNAEVYKSYLVGVSGRSNVHIWSHFFPGRSKIQIHATSSSIFINDSDDVAILDDNNVTTDFHLSKEDSIVSAKAYGVQIYLFCESGALYIVSAPGGHLGIISYIPDIFVEKQYYKSKTLINSDDSVLKSYLDSSPKNVLDFISFGLKSGNSLIMLVSKEGGEGLYLDLAEF